MDPRKLSDRRQRVAVDGREFREASLPQRPPLFFQPRHFPQSLFARRNPLQRRHDSLLASPPPFSCRLERRRLVGPRHAPLLARGCERRRGRVGRINALLEAARRVRECSLALRTFLLCCEDQRRVITSKRKLCLAKGRESVADIVVETDVCRRWERRLLVECVALDGVDVVPALDRRSYQRCGGIGPIRNVCRERRT